MLGRQIRGIIAISVILAFIPFIIYLSLSRIDTKGPVLSESSSQNIIIEAISENGASGIYFVEPGTSVNQLFSILEFDGVGGGDIKLQSGMRIRIVAAGNKRRIVVGRMEAATRLALGLPININAVGRDELKLIPGVGAVLAEKIVAAREKIGRFEKLDQLMEIKGIKEKKFSKISRYLYADAPDK